MFRYFRCNKKALMGLFLYFEQITTPPSPKTLPQTD